MPNAVAFTKSGTKAAAAQKLNNSVFGLVPENHELLGRAYQTYLANNRSAAAVTLKRGEVRGGGKKPWRQKGTGRARAGSRNSPIWRGGGITFGPTGNQNYSLKLPLKAKRLALRQALSLKAEAGAIKVIETFNCPDGKVKPTLELLKKLNATRNVLIIVSVKDILVERATRNLPGVKAASAKYLNVFDILNADTIIISKKSLKIIEEWLASNSDAKPATTSETKSTKVSN